MSSLKCLAMTSQNTSLHVLHVGKAEVSFSCKQKLIECTGYESSWLISATQDFQRQVVLGAKGSVPAGVSLDTLRRQVPAATTQYAAYGNPAKVKL